MMCIYGCGQEAKFTFKNKKQCCSSVMTKCPVQIEKMKKTQKTIDPITGLTPLELGIKKLKETIDEKTGLSHFDLRTLRMKESIMKKDPITGLSPRNIADEKLQQIDLETGKTLKQLAAQKAIITLNTIDPETGKTGYQKIGEKTSKKQRAFDKDKKREIYNKKIKTLNTIHSVTGLTSNQIKGIKISKNKNTVDPETGLTNAQKTALKLKNNQSWLKNNTRGRASKQSLKVFFPLVERLKEKNLKIYVGTKENREWFLFDTENKCVRFYDFCVPELKIIIEFHGERYHPNPQILTEEEWINWKTPYTKTSADDTRKLDLLKERIAIENGFDYHIVWSSCNVQEAIDNLYAIIIAKLTVLNNTSEL